MSVRRRKDGRWRVDVVVRRGGKKHRVRRAAVTRAAGLEVERRIRADLADVRRSTARAPLFGDWSGDFVTTYATVNNKPSEVDSKRQIVRDHLDPFFGSRRLDEIGVEHVERFKAQQLAKKLKPKTVNNHLTVLRRLLAVACDWGKLGAVPPIRWLKVPAPEFRFFDAGEGARLVDGAAPEWRSLLVVALRTGLRQGELLALRWEDVDIIACRLVVRRSVTRGRVGTPKNGRTRTVDLSDEAVSALRVLHSRLRGELVFCASDGRMLTKGETKWPLYSACRRAGLPRAGWHVLRHSFASQLVMAGVPLKAVQELMGHRTIEMTMRYAHLSPDVRQSAVRLLDAKPTGSRLGPDPSTRDVASLQTKGN